MLLKHCPSFHTITPCDSCLGPASLTLSDDGCAGLLGSGSGGSSVETGSDAGSAGSGLLAGLGESAEIGVEDVLALHGAAPLLRVRGTLR